MRWRLSIPLPSFIPFLDLCLQHARAAAPLETSALPGDLYAHEVPRDQVAREVVLRGGGQELRRAAVDDQRRVRLPVPDRPGFYELSYDADPAVRALIAVNPSPRESELRFTAEPAAVKAWSLPPRKEPGPATATLFPEMATRALGQRLWWWLLVAAGAALVTEGSLLWLRRERA